MDLILFFTKPKLFFAMLNEHPLRLRFHILVLFFIGLSYLFLLAIGVPNELNIDGNYLILSAMLFPAALMTAVFLLSVLIEGIWIQLFYKALHVTERYIKIISFLVCTSIPVLFYNILTVLLSRTNLVGYKMQRNYKAFYLKIDLSQLFSNTNQWDPFWFHVLQRIDPFQIWRIMLEVIAVATLGRLSYKKSFLIVIIFWIISLIPNFFVG